MKAPLSKRVLEILSDKIGSKKLVETAIVNPDSHDQSSFKIGDKKYQLQRVASYLKH
ncbi:MAG: hypothetical protein JXR03_20000 [Cyclobacteriaceae bacterium]